MTLKPLALWAAGLLALLLVAGAGYFSLRVSNRQAAAPVHSLRPDDPQVLRVGARIYAQQCAACHGARARAAQLA
jgi:mono/diheme cytochrome c family protein